MKIYHVGGSVRDTLLQRPVTDHDFVVVGATIEQMLKLGYKPVGKDFPVFLHPKTHQEYALARTEKKIAKGYHGFSFYADPSVTLEQDLYRRDLTINAIAQDENGQLFDPFSGVKDLGNRVLRHVSPAFKEDPVRLLRVARFAARYYDLGFSIADETLQLMTEMVKNGEVNALIAERVWQEVEKALLEDNAHIFFQSLRVCGALQVLLPEIDNLFGVPQTAKWHPEIDTGIHTMMVLQQAVKLTMQHDFDTQLAVRFAALMHDLGKAITPQEEWPSHKQHEHRGVKLVENLCHRLKIPKQIKELSLIVTEFHLLYHQIAELRNKTVISFFNRVDAFRRPERYKNFLLACEADSRGRAGFEEILPEQVALCHQYFNLSQKVSIQEIIKQGYQGKKISEQLNLQRQQVLAEVREK